MNRYGEYLTVFLGAGFGGALRHVVQVRSLQWWRPDLPVGTLIINVAGSFLIGVVAMQFNDRSRSTDLLRLFIMPGLLGGFTTFSAFSLDAAGLVQRSQFPLAALYVGGSVLLSLLAVALGLMIGGRAF